MKIQLMKTMLSVAVLTAITSNSWAAGTLAGNTIANTAQIDYTIGTTPQLPIESSPGGNSTPGGGAPTEFLVDKKVDVLVTGAASNAPATPGATNQVITFDVTNEGNSTEDFLLTPDGSAPGGNAFDATACAVTVPAALPVSLAPDELISVTVECTIPPTDATVINGATTEVDLLAEVDGAAAAAAADAANPDDPTAVETVLVDDTGTPTDGSDENAQHSATSTFVISGGDISVAKTSAVTADPSGGANPKRVPGATVEYTITVTNNSATVTATDIIITDVLPAGTTGTTATSDGVTFDSCSVALPAGAGACTNAAGTVISDPFALAPGETATLTIVTTVN